MARHQAQIAMFFAASRVWRRVCIVASLFIVFNAAFAAPNLADVKEVRISATGDTTRVVFDLSQDYVTGAVEFDKERAIDSLSDMIYRFLFKPKD